MDYNYDKNNKESIEQYARRLLNKSLNELNIYNREHRFNNKKLKGKLGQTVEESYFGYRANNKQEADFDEVGVELKVCPLKNINLLGLWGTRWRRSYHLAIDAIDIIY